MRDDLRRLAQASLTFDAPLSAQRAATLVRGLAISPGHHVLDLGCGWGELLLRMLAAHPATTGTGVDSDRFALDRARRLASQRGLQERADFVEADAATFDHHGDAILCVRASDAWGGAPDALRSIRRLIDQGGLALYGDAYWASPPGTLAHETIGDLPTHGHLLEAARGAGFLIEQAETSTLEEWDAFEHAWRSGLETSGLAEAADLAADRRRRYEDAYRGALGFAWLVLAPV